MVDPDEHTTILESILEEWRLEGDDESILHIRNVSLQRLPPLPNGVKYIQLCGVQLHEPFGDELPDSVIALEMRYLKSPPCTRFPPNLKQLKMLYVNWTTLPPLPHHLQKLQLHYLELTSLPNPLPLSLKYLYCSNLKNVSQQQQQQLPRIPDQVKCLELMRIPITVPPVLPDSIQYLDISYTSIEYLPEDYWIRKQNLKIIYCEGIQHLKRLPPLPNSLECLDCHDTSITVLPPLPGSLKELYCCRTILQSLPNLPTSLQILSAYDIPTLRTLPPLPDSLKELYIDSTPITYLELPPALTDLDCEDCPNLLVPRIPSSQSISMYRATWNSHIRACAIESCKTIKEELMMKLWSPENIQRHIWLLYDYEPV
jgi:hypothetical protein